MEYEDFIEPEAITPIFSIYAGMHRNIRQDRLSRSLPKACKEEDRQSGADACEEWKNLLVGAVETSAEGGDAICLDPLDRAIYGYRLGDQHRARAKRMLDLGGRAAVFYSRPAIQNYAKALETLF